MSNTAVISVNLPEWRNLWRPVRNRLEWIASTVAGVLIVWQQQAIAANFNSKDWDLGAFYSAVFDWSSIQGAFIFGVYAFFLSRSEPFIQAISSSRAFKMLRRYVVRTLYLTLILTVISLPMVVSPLAMNGGRLSAGFIVFTFQSTLAVYTFFCFLKVIRVFGKIERRS